MTDGRRGVLYIEDEEFDRFLMQRAFAKAGLGDLLHMANDGQAAIDYFEDCATAQTSFPDLVLLDLNLPEMPGFEVLRWIRSQPKFAKLPVLIFSSSEREEDQVQARELGADGFIKKPGSGLAFADIVHQISEHWLSRSIDAGREASQ